MKIQLEMKILLNSNAWLEVTFENLKHILWNSADSVDKVDIYVGGDDNSIVWQELTLGQKVGDGSFGVVKKAQWTSSGGQMKEVWVWRLEKSLQYYVTVNVCVSCFTFTLIIFLSLK